MSTQQPLGIEDTPENREKHVMGPLTAFESLMLMSADVAGEALEKIVKNTSADIHARVEAARVLIEAGVKVADSRRHQLGNYPLYRNLIVDARVKSDEPEQPPAPMTGAAAED